MSYALIPLTKANFEKILEDANGKILALNVLNKYPKAFESLPANSWARDDFGDSYLLNHYSDRDSGCYYIFFFKKKMYEIWIEPGMFKVKRNLKFVGDKPDFDIFNEVKEGLTAAFAVYGDLGYGDNEGMSSVIPVFSMEK